MRLLALLKEISSKAPSFLCSFSGALGVFVILSGNSHFWSSGGLVLFSNRLIGIAMAVTLALIGLIWSKRSEHQIKLSLIGFAAAAVLFFFSDWLCAHYNLLPGPTIRGEILLFAFLSPLIIAWSPRIIVPAIAAAIPIILACEFLSEANGRILISDDHAAFLYRLWALREHFPFVPFYSTLWNAGSDARDFFATGALAPYLLFSVLSIFLDLPNVYTALVCVILFALLPASLWISARLFGSNKVGAAIAVIVGVSLSLTWYEWALKYGTLGFICSATLFPIVLAIALKVFARDEQLTRCTALLLLLASCIMFLWSPSALACAPLGIFGLVFIKRALKKRYVPYVCIAIAVITAPWIIIFVNVSKVASFVPGATSTAQVTQNRAPGESSAHLRGRSAIPTLKSVLTKVSSASVPTNPLLLIFAIPGILLLKSERRWIVTAMSAWLIILGGVVSTFVPHMELERMFLFLALSVVTPSAIAIEKLFAQWNESPLARPVIALCAGFLFAGPASVCGVLRNRSLVQFYYAGPQYFSMAEAVERFNQGGRVLFSGFMLHQLNEAHIAPLVYLSNKTPLMASSPFHNQWRYRQIFPESFVARMNSGGIEEYLNWYNVGAVVAHEPTWQEYFRRHADSYSKVWERGHFQIFTRTNFRTNYVKGGNAQIIGIEADRIILVPQSEKIVLSFNYHPALEAGACKVSAEAISRDANLVQLSDCRLGEPTTLKMKSALARILDN